MKTVLIYHQRIGLQNLVRKSDWKSLIVVSKSFFVKQITNYGLPFQNRKERMAMCVGSKQTGTWTISS